MVRSDTLDAKDLSEQLLTPCKDISDGCREKFLYLGRALPHEFCPQAERHWIPKLVG